MTAETERLLTAIFKMLDRREREAARHEKERIERMYRRRWKRQEQALPSEQATPE